MHNTEFVYTNRQDGCVGKQNHCNNFFYSSFMVMGAQMFNTHCIYKTNIYNKNKMPDWVVPAACLTKITNDTILNLHTTEGLALYILNLINTTAR